MPHVEHAMVLIRPAHAIRLRPRAEDAEAGDSRQRHAQAGADDVQRLGDAAVRTEAPIPQRLAEHQTADPDWNSITKQTYKCTITSVRRVVIQRAEVRVPVAGQHDSQCDWQLDVMRTGRHVRLVRGVHAAHETDKKLENYALCNSFIHLQSTDHRQ